MGVSSIFLPKEAPGHLQSLRLEGERNAHYQGLVVYAHRHGGGWNCRDLPEMVVHGHISSPVSLCTMQRRNVSNIYERGFANQTAVSS